MAYASSAGEARLQRVSDLVQELDLLVLLVELHHLGRQRGPGLGERLLEGLVLRDLGGQLLGALGHLGLHRAASAEPAPEDEPREAGEEQASCRRSVHDCHVRCREMKLVVG